MNETLQTIHSLRSIRNFTEQEISEENIEIILQACVRAATASARQSYSVIVVSDKEKMRKHLQYVGSKALIFCVDYNRLADMADHLGYEYDPRDFVQFVTGNVDTILAAQTAAIAAKSLGIDSLFTNSVHRSDLNDLCQAFNIPTTLCFPLIALILGYPEAEKPLKERITGAGVIHFEQYKPLSLIERQELTVRYNQPESNLGLHSPLQREQPDVPKNLDWFYNVWTKPEKNKEKLFVAFLKQAGFFNLDS